VEGERIAMSAGDLVLTPAWCRHEHGNAGGEPVIWLDGLNAPLANLQGAWSFDAGPTRGMEAGAVEDARSGPAGGRAARALRYPYAGALHALACLQWKGEIDPVHGYRLRYIDPKSGRDPFPTMTIFMQKLPAGFHGKRVRSTDSAVYCVVAGDGRVETDETELALRPQRYFRHTVVARAHRVVADSARVLFGFSDRATQEALGLWREAR